VPEHRSLGERRGIDGHLRPARCVVGDSIELRLKGSAHRFGSAHPEAAR
jgi:hypothetical protein